MAEEGGAAQSVNDGGPGRGHPGLALVAAALLTALLACTLGAASLNWYATAAPGAGLTVRLCAGFTHERPARFGVAWQLSLATLSYVPPLLVSPYAACRPPNLSIYVSCSLRGATGLFWARFRGL